MPSKKSQKETGAEKPRRAPKPAETKERPHRERIHTEMMTVSIKGEYADRMRKLAEQAQMSLGKTLRDMILVYQERIEGGYQPGTSLQQSRESQAAEATEE